MSRVSLTRTEPKGPKSEPRQAAGTLRFHVWIHRFSELNSTKYNNGFVRRLKPKQNVKPFNSRVAVGEVDATQR